MSTRRMALPLSAVLIMAGCMPSRTSVVTREVIEIDAGDGTWLQKQIGAAQAAGKSELKLAPGRYRISGGHPQFHLTLNSIRDFTINAAGVTFLMTDKRRHGIGIGQAAGLTVRGLTIDWDPLPFCQVGIIDFDAGGRWIDVAPLPGYPFDGEWLNDAKDGLHMTLYDQTTLAYKQECSRNSCVYGNRMEKRSGKTWRVLLGARLNVGRVKLKIGDLAILKRRTGNAFCISRSERLAFENLTIYSAPSMGFLEGRGEGGTRYRGIRIVRGPTPPGATVPRLRSINNDGFHISGVKRGPIIENCTVVWQVDDAINVMGEFGRALNSGTVRRLGVLSQWGSPPGTELRVLRRTELTTRGRARATSITLVKGVGPYDAALIKELRSEMHHKSVRPVVYELILETPIDIAVGDWIAYPDKSGRGTIVRNNTFGHCAAHAIVLQVPTALVENNTIADTENPAILINSFMGPNFHEAIYSEDVVIRGNRITDAAVGGPLGSYDGSPQAGAISAVIHTKTRKPVRSPEHGKLLIENNIIDGCGFAAVVAQSTREVTIRGNTFKRTHQRPSRMAGRGYGMDATAAVFVDYCENLNLEDNQIVNPGPHYSKPLATGNNVKSVKHAENGLKLVKP